jgi:uncharacterized protein (DUF433 family)
MGAMAEPIIVIDPEVMNGIPCFRGTRVPFKNLMDYIEGGHSLGEFLRQFPTVTREMAVQALEEAKDRCSLESSEDSLGRVSPRRFPAQACRSRGTYRSMGRLEGQEER